MARLTRDRILDAALALAGREGAGALTMRGVAGELGAPVMSLYRHVSGRDDLLDGLAERLAESVDGAKGADARAVLRSLGRALHRALSGRAELAGVLGRRIVAGAPGQALVTSTVASLRKVGLTEAAARHAVSATIALALGSVVAGDAEAAFDASLNLVVSGVGTKR